MSVVVNNAQLAWQGSRHVVVEIPEHACASVALLVTKCSERHNGYGRVTFDTPRKPRSTGWKSQNHHFNGHLQQIVMETGGDFYEEKIRCKARAVPLGFPPPKEIRVGAIIATVFKSEADCDTQECGYLIEAAHLEAAELGIVLVEE